MDSTSCSTTVDHTFGPWAGQCRGGFDFTLLFEETILALFPICAFLLTCPSRLLYLKGKPVRVEKSILMYSKLVSIPRLYLLKSLVYQKVKISWTFYIALQIVLLIFWTRPSSLGTELSIPLAAISLFSGILFLATSYFEHQRTIRPSTILGVFLFVSLLCNCARTRTLWLRQSESAIPIAMTLLVAMTAILLVVESIGKRKILLQRDQHKHTPEATAGIFNRYFFVWLNPLFKEGYTKALTIEGLSNLDKHLTSRYLARVSSQDWKIGKFERRLDKIYSCD